MQMMLLLEEFWHTYFSGLSQLMEKGPAYGYYSEPSKSYWIVDEPLKTYAEELLDNSGIKVDTDRRFWVDFLVAS